MKVLIERDKALAAVTRVQSVVDRRMTIPILQNILIATTRAGVKFQSTDLDMQATSTAEGRVEEKGEITVAGATLFDLLRSFPPGGEVEMSLGTASRLVVKCGRAKFQLPTLPAGDFPIFPDAEATAETTISGKDLRRLLDKVAFAISKEATRYYLCGVFLHLAEANGAGVLRAVATNGHLLASVEMAAPEGLSGGVLIPAKMVHELRRLVEPNAGDVALSWSKTGISVDGAGGRLMSKVIDGTFPDYARVIPSAVAPAALVDAGLFAAAIKRAALVSTEKVRSVRLAFEAGKVTVTARGATGGECDEPVEADYAGPDSAMGFSVAYLLDVVGQMDGEAFRVVPMGGNDPVRFLDPLDPASVFVVMPLRL